MPIGPVEYLVVGFPGNKFTGKIAPELKALVDSGTVRVLDLVFVGKDVDGSVVVFESMSWMGWPSSSRWTPTSVASSVRATWRTWRPASSPTVHARS